MQHRKKKVNWHLIITIFLVLSLVANLMLYRQEKDKTSSAGQSTSKTVASKVSKASSHSTKTTLNANGLGPQTTATSVAYYASQNLKNSQDYSENYEWQYVYKALAKRKLQLVVSKENISKMSDSGNGVVFYFVPSNGSTDPEQLKNYPSYVLSNDKSIYFYAADAYDKPQKVTTLQHVTDYIDNQNAKSKIKAIRANVNIKNELSEANSNDITAADLRKNTNNMRIKALIVLGVNKYASKLHDWKVIKEAVDQKSVIRVAPIQATADTSNYHNACNVSVTQAGGSRLVVWYDSPDNSNSSNHTDDYYYRYGHLTGGDDNTVNEGSNNPIGIVYDDYNGYVVPSGYSVTTVADYVNKHGGRSALDNVVLTSDSELPIINMNN